MCKQSKLFILALALLGSSISAIPVNDYIDELDDTEVVELPNNEIDEIQHSESPEDIIDLSAYGMALYGLPDNDVTAAKVANYSAEDASVNPEELGTYLEGDILMPSKSVLTKNGLTTQSSRWPKGIVPFEIRGSFGARDMATIEHAMEEYHRRTCIRFVPRTNQRDYISIVSGSSGCWSSVGRVGGKQEVNLQAPGCLTKPGTAIHELMHALGFLHEQNRMERDSFVAIQYQNVQQSAASNFEKAAQTVAFGVPYDYGSVMHYSANAFSTNGRPTIVALQPDGGRKMGQRDGFSPSDVEKLNKMYDCGYGGNVAVSAPAPVPVSAPNAGPAIAPAPGAAGTNNIVAGFLGGLLTGLGLGDENTTTTTQS